MKLSNDFGVALKKYQVAGFLLGKECFSYYHEWQSINDAVDSVLNELATSCLTRRGELDDVIRERAVEVFLFPSIDSSTCAG